MLIDFAVQRRGGLVASLDADRVDPGDDNGAYPDAGGGDGSQPFDEHASLDGSEDGGAGDPESTRQASGDESGEHDDDDDDDDDARYEGLPAEERIKRLNAALKKKKRQLSKRSPVFQRVEELRRQGVSLDDLLVSHRQFAGLVTRMRTNPKLRALLEAGGDEVDDRRPARSSDRRQEPDTEFRFDDSPEALGFDKDASPANRTLAAGLKRVAKLEHDLGAALRRIDAIDPDRIGKIGQRVDGIEQSLSNSQRRSIEREWDTAIRTAVTHITDPNPVRQDGMRTVFMDAMKAALYANGGKRPASDFVAHYFKKLGIKPQAAGRATAAARQAQHTATRVQGLQRQPTQSGQPAPANNKKRLLADVHRDVKNSVGSGAR